jgi:hypothetical protein
MRTDLLDIERIIKEQGNAAIGRRIYNTLKLRREYYENM